jgi:hypothetical protein
MRAHKPHFLPVCFLARVILCVLSPAPVSSVWAHADSHPRSLLAGNSLSGEPGTEEEHEGGCAAVGCTRTGGQEHDAREKKG